MRRVKHSPSWEGLQETKSPQLLHICEHHLKVLHREHHRERMEGLAVTRAKDLQRLSSKFCSMVFLEAWTKEPVPEPALACSLHSSSGWGDEGTNPRIYIKEPVHQCQRKPKGTLANLK